jgi:hypothetical protein
MHTFETARAAGCAITKREADRSKRQGLLARNLRLKGEMMTPVFMSNHNFSAFERPLSHEARTLA